MPAHGGRRLLVFVGIELIGEHCRCIRQHGRRHRDVEQSRRGLCQNRPIADGKEAEINGGQVCSKPRWENKVFVR